MIVLNIWKKMYHQLGIVSSSDIIAWLIFDALTSLHGSQSTPRSSIHGLKSTIRRPDSAQICQWISGRLTDLQITGFNVFLL
jgi:hypothetical protein